MADKFGHERLNRLERVWNPSSHAVGGTEDDGKPGPIVLLSRWEGNAFSFSKEVSPAYFKKQFTAEASEAFHRQAHKAQYSVGDYRISLRDTIETFAHSNGMTSIPTTRTFKDLRGELNELIEMAWRSTLRSPVLERHVRGGPLGYRKLNFVKSFIWKPLRPLSTLTNSYELTIEICAN